MAVDTVLARKWRPKQFSEVIGQELVVRALRQALVSGRLHHAYLFTGTRGVGKTTLARIFAKALNCRTGVSAEPCQDDVAQAIDEGRFVDLIEIDAASRTKVEDTRELLENIQYAPSVGRYKIYIIDEVHMLSNHSFNALLKTLEEPPAHVKFLLATTDPHKLPVTILSRCLQFHLRPMTTEVLVAHLAKVLTEESVSFDPLALDVIARMAQGSVRDALSLLDQAIALGSGLVAYEATRQMLGLAAETQMLQLLACLIDSNRSGVLSQLQEWQAWGADFDRLQQQLLELLHDISMMQNFPELRADQDQERGALADRASSEQVQLWLQVALLAQDDMRLAPTSQMGFELMLVRLMFFRTNDQATLAPPMVVAPSLAQKKSRDPESDVSVEAKPEIESPHLAALAAVGSKKSATKAEKKTLEFASLLQKSEERVVQPAPLMSHTFELTSVEDWLDCIRRCRLSGGELALAKHCVRLAGEAPTTWYLACDPVQTASLTLLGDRLLSLVQRELGQNVSWLREWQSDWVTPVQYEAQQERAVALAVQSQVSAHPRFVEVCRCLALTPDWGRLVSLK